MMKNELIEPAENTEIDFSESPVSEVEAAKAKIEDLRQKILGGDEKLTAQDLANARGELEFAELREAARAEREANSRRAARREELLALQGELKAVAPVEAFEPMISPFAKSLDRYLAKMVDRNAEIRRINELLLDRGFISGRGNFEPVEDISASINSGLEPTRIGDVEGLPFYPRERIEQLVSNILQKYFPTGRW